MTSQTPSRDRQETAVIGGGICGRLVALRLVMAGHQVTLFESRGLRDRVGCSATAAGMLTPFAEAVYGEVLLADLGLESLNMWKDLGRCLFEGGFAIDSSKDSLDGPPKTEGHRISFLGSLVLAHDQNLDELNEFRSRIQQKFTRGSQSLPLQQVSHEVSHTELLALEPCLAQHFSKGIFFPQEGHVNTWAILDQLRETLEVSGVIIREQTQAVDIKAHKITFKDQEDFLKTQHCDMVFDCRGIGAREDLPTLRGVRGETLILKIPQNQHRIQIKRPVRILHPRYPLYIVPRTFDTYVVGASMIESDSDDAISVQSVLELLTALYHCHENFKFASIIGSMTSVRPAFTNNCPQIILDTGIMRINGLFRHGFLLAPIVAKTAVDLYANKEISPIQRILVRG